MAARRAARAAARAAARPAGAPECLGRRVLGPASRADEDVTELDSIPAGRIDQTGPHRITDFRPAAFHHRSSGVSVVAPASESHGDNQAFPVPDGTGVLWIPRFGGRAPLGTELTRWA